MKSIVEVLKQKEQELQQTQAEVDALRIALQLLSDDGDNHGRPLAQTGTSSESRVNVKEINSGSNATRQFP